MSTRVEFSHQSDHYERDSHEERIGYRGIVRVVVDKHEAPVLYWIVSVFWFVIGAIYLVLV